MLRPGPPRRGATLVRILRVLALLLAVTGCAVDAPRPVAVTPPDGLEPPAPMIPPAVVSRFGEVRSEGGESPGTRHAGIDMRAPMGTPVLAAADGVVRRTGSAAHAGRLVVLGHASGLATAYYHLSRIEVAPGQGVRRGEVIGRVGATGNATAPHLHFGVCVREDGQCGARIEAGWEDPERHWVAGSPCFRPERDYASDAGRLTYPLPCLPAASARTLDPAPAAPGRTATALR